MASALRLELLEIARQAPPWIPVGFCFTDYVASVSLVSGRSMQPTFNSRGPESHDAILLDKWSARRRSYGRGDVVVLQSPVAPQEQMTSVSSRSAATGSTAGDRSVTWSMSASPASCLWHTLAPSRTDGATPASCAGSCGPRLGGGR